MSNFSQLKSYDHKFNLFKIFNFNQGTQCNSKQLTKELLLKICELKIIIMSIFKENNNTLIITLLFKRIFKSY